MKEFLETYPLYKEYLLLEEYKLGNQDYVFKSDFDGINFDYYCEREQGVKPFQIVIEEETKPLKHSPERKDRVIPDDHFIDDKLNYFVLARGMCKSCEEYSVYFLLNVYSNNPISSIFQNYRNVQLDPRHAYDFPETNIYIKKVGCSHQKKVIIKKEITKHFDRETNNWLFKAKSSLESGFGIGAFAYCRRIIEKELITIIQEIRSLPDSNALEIGKLLEEYEDNPRTSTIYDNIIKYLPGSLKSLQDNPISLLYKQTSEGLHNLTEAECLERAGNIIRILEFTISKIKEEKSEIKDVKDAIKNLRSNQEESNERGQGNK